jgi:hypothetical protein
MSRHRNSTSNEQPEETTQKLLWKIAIYIRLSKEDGNDESNSVVNQRKIANEHLRTKFDGDYIVVDEYIDDGLTGTDDTRANFQRMILDIEVGKVNCVIVKNLSRAFRNYADQGHYLENYFTLHHTRFVTISDTIPLDTYIRPEAVHGFEVPMTGVMNDRHAYRTSMDVRQTFHVKRSKGEFIGAFAPYGYTKDPQNKNKLVIDEEAAEVVRQIFVWFTRDGRNKMSISAYLNEMGYPNPTEYKRRKGFAYNNSHLEDNDTLWSFKTVGTILKNKMYIGVMVQGQQRVISYKVHNRIIVPESEWYVVPGTHESIVTEDVFETAQRLLTRDTRTAPQQQKLHLFAGLIRCADCKKAMTRKTAKQHVYYNCRTYNEKSKTKCTKHSIREDVLQDAVLLAIQKQIELVGSLSDIIEAINKAPGVRTESRRLNVLLRQHTTELAKVISSVDSLYMDWKNEDLTREEYLRLKSGLNEKADNLREVIRNINDQIKVMSQGVRTDEPFLKAFMKYQNIKHLERGLLVELVDTIYVFEGKELQIDFNFIDQYQRAIDFIEMNRKESALITNQTG